MTAAYHHGEAFCLMTYRCDACGREEILWNSRDGVTPFMISCFWEGSRKCGGHMMHVDWRSDIREPAYHHRLSPNSAMRIFVDANDPHVQRRLAAAARRYVDLWWNERPDRGGPTMRETLRKPSGAQMTKGEAVDYFLKEWTAPGEPAIITAREYFEQVVAS